MKSVETFSGQTAKTAIKAAQSNWNFAKSKTNLFNKSKFAQRDTLTISPQGKAAQLIDNLMNQKAAITERKNEYLTSAMEQQTPMEVIQNQLERYNEQIETIDKQISEITAQQMKTDAEQQKTKPYNKPKTTQEMEDNNLAALTHLSMGLEEMEQLDSIKTKVEREMSCLQSEIKLDKLTSNGMKGTKKLILSKEDTLSEMQKEYEKISSALYEKITDTTEEIEENNKQPVIDSTTPEKEDEKEQSENQTIEKAML